jgi:hypothetical protein
MFGTIKININNSNNKKENFYCQICLFPLISKDDFIKNSKYECCQNCFLNFVEARKDKWLTGWRPNQKEIDSYIKNQIKLYKKIGAKSEF